MSDVWPHRSYTVNNEGTMSMTISVKYDDEEEDNEDKASNDDDENASKADDEDKT